MPYLGINIDHVATLRQARRGFEPDPLLAARLCEKAGADSIVVHLREDRRHINEHDVKRLRRIVKTRLNLEMSLANEIVRIALAVKPDQVTLVPEKRREVTTEGGLDVAKNFNRIKHAARLFAKKGITVSLFVDPVKAQIKKTHDCGIPMIELHTGCYANAKTSGQRQKELKKIKAMTRFARSLGIIVNAGHGLNYQNTRAVARIQGISELNIGHSVVSRAVFVGLKKAVTEMKKLAK